MASLILSKFATPSAHHRPQIIPPLSLSSSSPTSISTQLGYCRHWRTRRSRGLSLVTRAAPGTMTYIFAFVFPLSLIAATVFTSIQISDKLDRDFYEELLVYKAILDEAGDDDDDDDDAVIFADEEAERPKSRNRPTREVEV